MFIKQELTRMYGAYALHCKRYRNEQREHLFRWSKNYKKQLNHFPINKFNNFQRGVLHSASESQKIKNKIRWDPW